MSDAVEDSTQTEAVLPGAMFVYSDETRTQLEKIARERMRQVQLWGGKEHDDYHQWSDWMRILRSEVDEAGESATLPREQDDHYFNLRSELVQVAAVAVAWLEVIERISPTPTGEPGQVEMERPS